MDIFKVFSPSDWACLNSKSPIKKIDRDKFATHLTLQENGVTFMNLPLPEKDKLTTALTLTATQTSNKYDTQIQELEQKNQELINILEDCNRIISEIMTERECNLIINEILNTNLANAESAFNDIHHKYERAKQVVEGFQQNELILRDAIKENERTILELDNRFEILKHTSTTTLEDANEAISTIQKEFQVENNRLKTKIKMMELTVNTLENNLQQKTIENDKLSKICDEFIYKK